MKYMVKVAFTMTDGIGCREESSVTIPMNLQAAARVLQNGGTDTFVQKTVEAMAELQGYKADRTVVTSVELDRTTHPNVTEEELVNRSHGYIVAYAECGHGVKCIKRVAEAGLFDTDADAAAAAERSGLNYIKDLPLSRNDADFAFYLDTPVNRRRLESYLCWHRGIAWPESGAKKNMYIRIGSAKLDMKVAVDILAKEMGVENEIYAAEVAIGCAIPEGELEAVMSYSLRAALGDDPYPGMDVLWSPIDGSAPIQMVRVEQNTEEGTSPTTYLYHRCGEVMAHMAMPNVPDSELEQREKDGRDCSISLIVDGGEEGFPLIVERKNPCGWTTWS